MAAVGDHMRAGLGPKLAGQEAKYFKTAPKVAVEVDVAPHDRDTRVVLCAIAIALLGIAWTGSVNLLRIVRSARGGDPFDSRNVARLRWIAVSMLLIPVVTEIASRVVNGTLDVDPGVSVQSRMAWWPFLVTAFVLAAVAQGLREGRARSRPRELEPAAGS